MYVGSGDVRLAIFIISVSSSESLASFINRFFHFSGPPGCRMAFDVAERNGRFGRIQCQRSEESSSRGKSIPLQKDSESQSKKQVIPASFLKVEGRGTLVGAKNRREMNR